MIPTEIVSEARQLYHETEMDVMGLQEKQERGIDDEYSNIGLKDPKVCITTSRDPSSRLKQFAKEMRLCVPNAQVINRGNTRTDELEEVCRQANYTDLIVLNETRGNPDGMIVCHLPFGPTAYFSLSNCVLRHDIPEVEKASQVYPRLIIDGFTTKIGQRISRILQALYPVPKEDNKRVITFANCNDFISFRHHTYKKTSQHGRNEVTIKEAGPRFELQPYEVKLGTLNQVSSQIYNCGCRLPFIPHLFYLFVSFSFLLFLQKSEAEKEWVLRPFMNTSRKNAGL